MSYEKKLMEMKKLLTKPVKRKVTAAPKGKPPSPSYEELWLAAGLVKEENDHGVVYKKVVHYDLNYKHGDIELNELSAAIDFWEKSNENHPLAPDLSKRMVFFDTETTGLKGAGTLIFLLGFIEQTANGFEMVQYVLPNPEHESAFLYASKLWETEVTLVTYNGKSFDVPQLETRWTMNRNALPPLLKHAQIDLLHGSRRIWRDEIHKFNLTTIEEEKLGFHREGDIPGHLAPIIYQDAVKSGRIESLMKVLLHNEWDILSLVALYIQATKLLLKETTGTAISETNIGKWYAYLKSYDKGQVFFEEVIEQYGTTHPITHYHFGFILKRNMAYEEAVESFSIAAENLSGRERIIALEELAKLYEHKLKILEKAYVYSQQAQHHLKEDQDLTTRFRIRAQESFQKREERVLRKISTKKGNIRRNEQGIRLIKTI